MINKHTTQSRSTICSAGLTGDGRLGPLQPFVTGSKPNRTCEIERDDSYRMIVLPRLPLHRRIRGTSELDFYPFLTEPQQVPMLS